MLLPFKTLYKRRQNGPVVVPITWYVEDAKELHWVNDCIQIKRTHKLPKEQLRGMIIRHEAGFMPNARDCNYSIFIAANLTREMERFVIIKELMHLYFGPDGGGCATDTQFVLQNHIQEMFGSSAEIKSMEYTAEKQAFWMAISVITTEIDRLNFKDKLEAGELSINDVAAKLRIPQHTASALLSSQFDHEISNLLS
jgi:hypothetical protein